MPFYRSHGNFTPTMNHREIPVMLAVALIHGIFFMWLFYRPAAVSSQQPVLSFTVTLSDLSSSHHSISSAASAASTPQKTTKTPKRMAEAVPNVPAATLSKAVEENTVPTPPTNAPMSYSSEAQTAVLSPTIPAQFDAAYLHNPPPKYPPLSRRLGETGNVTLRVYVNEQGKAETISVEISSGFTRLDNAAIEAVLNWRFIAAQQEEKLIASWVQVPVKFILE